MPFSDGLAGVAYGTDIYFDIVSSAILLFLFIVVARYVSLSKDIRKYQGMLWGFGLMASAYVAKIFSHFTVYYHRAMEQDIGVRTLTHHWIQSSDVLVFWGLVIYRILLLLGLYGLYRTYASKDSTSSMWLTGILLVMLGWLTMYAYVLFHVIALAMLVFIAHSIYRKTAPKSTTKCNWTLIAGFGILALSHVVFIITAFIWQAYYIADFLQVLASLVLLATFIGVIIHGKKKG